MTPAFGKESVGAGGIEPSQRQFIEETFRETFADGIALDSRREELIQVAYRRLFLEGASIAAVRLEIQRNHCPTRVIAMTSGKGGVGKTTVSVNLAVAFAQNGLRVLLFDADLGMANMHIFAGVNPKATIADVLTGHSTLRDAIMPGPAGVNAICGASGVGWLADLSHSQIESLGRELLGIAADYDVLIIDTGAGISSAIMQFLGLAHDIIVVATPNLAATLDAYGVIKLARESRIAAQLHVVINQSDSQSDARHAAERIITCATRFLNYTPVNLGWLKRDLAVERANQNRCPLQISNPTHPNARCIARFATALTAQSPQAGEFAAA